MKIKKELLEKDYLNTEQAEDIQKLIDDEIKDIVIIGGLAFVVYSVLMAVI